MIPEPVQNLLEYGVIKLKAENLRIRSIEASDGSVFFQLSQGGPVKTDTILAFIRKHKESRLSPTGLLTCRGEKLYIPKRLFSTLNELLNELASC